MRRATPVPQTITVNGSSQVEPKPKDRTSNASINKVVAAARAKAVPRAVADGRQRGSEDLGGGAGGLEAWHTHQL